MTSPTTGDMPGLRRKTSPFSPAADHSRHRLAIHATATGQGSAVTIDGRDITSALTSLTLSLGVGQVPTATLDLLLLDVTEVQEAETRILIPDATRDALTALGWTPPDGTEPTQ